MFLGLDVMFIYEIMYTELFVGPFMPLLGYFRVHCLCSAYGSREMFCDAYTLSIPWWTSRKWSHRFILPRWLLLRNVIPAIHLRKSSFSTVSAMAIPGFLLFFQTSLARWRHGIGSPIT